MFQVLNGICRKILIGFMMKISLFFTIFFIMSCMQEKEIPATNLSSQEGPYTPAEPIIYNADYVEDEKIDFTIDGINLFSENVSSNYIFVLRNAPSFLSINSSTAEITGTSPNQGYYGEIVIRAIHVSNGSIIEKQFSLGVNGDPLRQFSWHLNNTGQKAFSRYGGTSGIDINVDSVLLSGTTGAGVRIAISDSGTEINHDDLHENGLEGEHRDYSLSAPYIGDPVATSAHGTAVAGIIAAMKGNNIGSHGVAPEAKFAAFQFLNSLQDTSIMVSQASGNFDIFNFSYGDSITHDILSNDTYVDHLRYQYTNLNRLFVKSAGNEFALSSGSLCASHNANFPMENESPYMLVVGALNADGVKSSYSSSGSNIWISAPGGEYGIFDPAIITTDLPTCFKGYSKSAATIYNSFEFGHELNTKCDYTSVMNGTSSAAPVVTGVIALMKSVNSALTARDIKHILATTAVKVDPNHTDNYYGKDHPSASISKCSTIYSPTGYDYELGWVQNSAGYWFNNFYGFGLIDAKAAVEMAQTYSVNLGTLNELNSDFTNGTYLSTPAVSIPDNDKDGVQDSISISDNLTVESIQVKVNITHPKSGEIGVHLISPNGTESLLMNINNSFLLSDDTDLNIVLASHAFYGENSNGNWTIKIIDGQSSNIGTLNSWSINILGH